jgi:hypothetical protein
VAAIDDGGQSVIIVKLFNCWIWARNNIL